VSPSFIFISAAGDAYPSGSVRGECGGAGVGGFDYFRLFANRFLHELSAHGTEPDWRRKSSRREAHGRRVIRRAEFCGVNAMISVILHTALTEAGGGRTQTGRETGGAVELDASL